jgi:nucleoid-associated protein YgaU
MAAAFSIVFATPAVFADVPQGVDPTAEAPAAEGGGVDFEVEAPGSGADPAIEATPEPVPASPEPGDVMGGDAVAATPTPDVVDAVAGSPEAAAQEAEAMEDPLEGLETSAEPVAESAESGAGDVDLSSTSVDWDDLGATEEPAPLETDALVGSPVPPLGAVGYDSDGRQGRIHLVVPSDTLWDISDAYLGTPWVWPSIWKDNRDIENPHLIHPGDRIWITPHEMRRVTPEEADALLANQPAQAETLATVPAAPEAEEPVGFQPVPAAMPESAPLAMRSLKVSAIESAGLVSPEQLAASASVVGKIPERVFLTQEDQLYIGLGESDVDVGDQFTVFRTKEKVYDPDTGRLLGYHVAIVGWIEVDESYAETSRATVRMSTTGVAVKDRLIPREPLPQEIALQPSPEGVEGKISFFPQRRVLMGHNDFVYLNRGSLDGLEVGSPLEVYRAGYGAQEVTRHEDVAVPDRVVAKMVVVRAATEASVAVITNTDTELKLGDRFRAEQ